MIKKIQDKYINKIDFAYMEASNFCRNLISICTPYLRRLIRFFALPYCYFKLVNWQECPVSRWQVFKDHLFIFFKLKYFPDNYSLCHLWEKDRSEWCYYYGSIYEPYQRARLRKEVQKKEYEIIFEDKYICYQLCKAANLPLPRQHVLLSPDDDYRSLIHNILKKQQNKMLIIKPVRGKGGSGIALAVKRNDRVIMRTSGGELSVEIKDFHLDSHAVAQEYIQQHDKLSEISPSTNTVRIVTLLTKKREVIIVGAIMRFGVGNAFIDNRCMGGMAAGIDLDQGKLKKFAYDLNSKKFQYHPSSNIRFEGFVIPRWKEVVALAKEIQFSFPFFKLLGHDIAITSQGPVIIEINSAHDNVGLEQAYGPILADNRVRNEFCKYNLLISVHP